MEDDAEVPSVPLLETRLVALQLEGGPIFALMTERDDEEIYLGDEKGIFAYSAATSDPRELMRKARALAARLASSTVPAEFYLPMSLASQEPVAGFLSTNGNLCWVSDEAPEWWKPLRRAAQRVTFVTNSADARLIRSLSEEIYPGILVTPYGEVAVRDGKGWTPIDENDPEDLAEEILPRLRAHVGATAEDETLLRALLTMTNPFSAYEALGLE